MAFTSPLRGPQNELMLGSHLCASCSLVAGSKGVSFFPEFEYVILWPAQHGNFNEHILGTNGLFPKFLRPGWDGHGWYQPDPGPWL